MLVHYTIQRHCDVSYIVKEDYDVMLDHANVSDEHLSFISVK